MSPLERALVLLDESRVCFDGTLHDRVTAFLAQTAPESGEPALSAALDLLSEASMCIDGTFGYRIEGFLAKERRDQTERLRVDAQRAANERAAAALWPEYRKRLSAGEGLRYIDLVLAMTALRAASELALDGIQHSAEQDVCTLLPPDRSERVLGLLRESRRAAFDGERDGFRDYNRLCREIDLALV